MATLAVAARLSTAELGQRYRAARYRIRARRTSRSLVPEPGPRRAARSRGSWASAGAGWAEVVRRYNAGGRTVWGTGGAGTPARGRSSAPRGRGGAAGGAGRAARRRGLWTGPKVAAWMRARLGRKGRPSGGGTTCARSATARRGRGRGTPRRRARGAGGVQKGSIRVGCWDRPCGSQEPGFRGTWLGRPLEGSSPAEIVRQVARRDAVEATHPALQPAVVGVHVLAWKAPSRTDAGREVDRLVVEPEARRRRWRRPWRRPSRARRRRRPRARAPRR